LNEVYIESSNKQQTMKFQNIIYLSILILMLLAVKLNAQNWQWAKQIGSSYNGYERINNVFCDDNNIYVVGSYGSSLIFLQIL